MVGWCGGGGEKSQKKLGSRFEKTHIYTALSIHAYFQIPCCFCNHKLSSHVLLCDIFLDKFDVISGLSSALSFHCDLCGESFAVMAGLDEHEQENHSQT